MNKKFSTLMAGLLLAGSFGSVSAALTGATAFEDGKAYILSNGTQALAVEAASVGATPKLKIVTDPTGTTSLTNLQKALWRVTVTPGVNGANPTYTFVNVYTGTPLAVNSTTAVDAAVATAQAEMGGDITAWQNDPAFNPITSSTKFPLYSTFTNAGKDSAYVLSLNASAADGVAVGLIKRAKNDISGATNDLEVKPYAADGVILTANDLNTKLGTVPAGSFKLTFNPEVANSQWGNVLSKDLLAEAGNMSFPGSLTGSEYVRLKDATTGSKKYVYVDTTYVATQNVAVEYRRLKIVMAEPKNISGTDNLAAIMTNRGHFKFTYFATNDSLTIDVANATDKNNLRAGLVTGSTANSTDAETWADWADGISGWSAADNEGLTQAAGYNFVKLVYLTEQTASTAAHSEVTVGNAENVTGLTPATTLRTRISLGAPLNYTAGAPADGVYIIKVKATGANALNKDGRYIIDNLAGNIEKYAVQSIRQNYQDMPATQWVVKTNGAIATIKNREFGNDLQSAGLMYKAGNNFFYMGGDTLEFIPVTKVDDKYLGYKYLSADTLSDHVFTFNYLHQLAMDKPINTKMASDSVVWVDKDGNKMTFSLERLLDDTYGYNAGLKGVAELTRSVYYIKVNDPSKLQNNGRYLTYDDNRKQYVVKNYTGKKITSPFNYMTTANITSITIDGATVTTVDKAKEAVSADAPTPFFLKENNEVEGGECYYTLIPAELAVVKSGDKSVKMVVKDADYKPALVTAYNSTTNEYTSAEGSVITTTSSAYAVNKVSVDNNTLALVNGVVNDGLASEVANSAFAVIMDKTPLYRRLNDATVGENADDTPNVLKFFRVNSSAKEYLYEDANSKYSADLGVNFLGVEGKGDAKNAAMYVDTAYVQRNTKMPQYMLVLNPTVVKADTVWCNATSTHSHATLADSLACPHTTVTKGYVEGRYLINLQDSVDASNTPYTNKYVWNTKYTRLAFVHAKHIDDKLVIFNDVKNDTIDLANNKHKNVVFSFRLVKNDSNDFLIESETQKNGANIKNSALDVVSIAPQNGGWVKIQNGVPVIANMTYAEAGLDAEVFNVEATDENPTANEAIAAEGVQVIGGQGVVTVQGAAGKVITVANILGQTIANQVAASDNVTIAAPAGVVVVAVDGDATKVVVK